MQICEVAPSREVRRSAIVGRVELRGLEPLTSRCQRALFQLSYSPGSSYSAAKFIAARWLFRGAVVAKVQPSRMPSDQLDRQQ